MSEISLSAIQAMGRGVVKGPRLEVRWDGFESNTWAMAAAGWEFAIDTGWRGRGHIELWARHRVTGHSMLLRGSASDLLRSSTASWIPHDPVLEVVAFQHSDKIIRYSASPGKYARVDVMPEFVEEKPLSSFAHIFRPWAEGAREIIANPKTVAELMAEIVKLQEPELAEIRRRQRRRESTETVVAQVIAFEA